MTRSRDKHYWQRLFLFGLLVLVVALVIVVANFSHRVASLYLHPPRMARAAGDTPDRLGIPFQDVSLLTGDGLELSAWYTPSENGVVILVAHGHANSRLTEVHALFARHGYGVVSWDFRAHGESAGEICTFGYYEALDVEAALEFALAQEGVERVGAWGGSMGGAAVIEAAGRRPEIGAVVVDSIFPTIEEALDRVVGVAALRPLIRLFAELETGLDAEMLRPVEVIGQISPRPVLIIQGMADSVIPPDSGQRMYNAAGEPRELWVEPGVEHLGMFVTYPEQYERRVISFFDTALLGME